MSMGSTRRALTMETQTYSWRESTCTITRRQVDGAPLFTCHTYTASCVGKNDNKLTMLIQSMYSSGTLVL